MTHYNSENSEAKVVPPWLDPAIYPFESHWFTLPEGRMHYVDEGSGKTILFVHGNPSWSFEYRNLIRSFARTHRCIAIDHLGFGMSDKPTGASYLPQFHADNLRRFIDALDLHDVTLVVQDWGGPIALGVALDQPSRFRGIVASNSWFFDVRDYTVLRWFSRIVGSPIGRWLCGRLNFFPRVLMKASFGDKVRLTAHIHDHYLAPFPTKASRKGTWVFPKAIVGESEWLARLWARRDRLSDKPVLLAWGMKDDAFVPLLPQWQSAFSRHRLVMFDDVGHNVAEEAGQRLVEPIATFIAEIER